MEPLPNNTRYILELQRKALLQEKHRIDEKYGTFSFAFLTSLEAFALLAYFYIATVLIYYKKTRTKTNFIVSLWALINFAVLLEKLSREFGVFIENAVINKEAVELSQMIAGLGRVYGTLLSIVWLYSKYFGTPKPNYDPFIYLMIATPALVCFYYIYYYFAINRFIFESYGPACDVGNVTVYLFVALMYTFCKIFMSTNEDTTQYALLISLINLVTNFPNSLITIYSRFNLDISWSYRFHIYFVDIFIDALSCSGAFFALIVIILYNTEVKKSFFGRRKNKNVYEAESNLLKTQS